MKFGMRYRHHNCISVSNVGINRSQGIGSCAYSNLFTILRIFERLDDIDEEGHLFTDSGSVLMALHSVKHTHPLIDKIKLLLVNKPNISLKWVKADIGIGG
ncbi:hypothetical protein AVEN_60891-1 [Araneus ventricosus]|uniref:Reverse transcriptase domain-containing protein n=1 Tax=Araneus ventricosus TaxID=182803 RepID=A0A4Y2PSI2_ARAVE|nr:hypothetical protein AVEN_60891-1 [Araneus ventricosus]